MQGLRDYLQKEHQDKKKKPLDLSDWVDYEHPVSLLSQRSSSLLLTCLLGCTATDERVRLWCRWLCLV